MRNINIRSVDLNLLVTFDALYSERSVTRAATQLSLTQPTVSGMLKRLREVFEDDLFVRTSHGIIPTPKADAIALKVNEVLEEIRVLLAPDAFDPANSEFTVRVCGSDYLQHTIFNAFTEKVLDVAPRARVSVLPRPATGILDQLEKGEIDLILSDRDLALPDLPARALYTDDFVCLSSYSNVKNNDELSLEQLCEHRHAFVDPTGASFRGPIDEVLAAKGMSRHVVLAVPTFAMLIHLMKSRSLTAFIPERIARSFKHSFARIRTPLELPYLDIVANWHPRMNRDARHLWLRETLLEVARLPKNQIGSDTSRS
ncbi:Nodulation protein D 2 [Labrenzia sp. THAF82]|uniref:LysR family transcriptional regulator n=1 Tax=Labrenzia sp. THAF82 TaxID=2587861 RepID=UPI00126953AB|nr:LysR family transcriptional regulator [Labrenzia sp. THAF82]QFT33523.1 Nodulation protein D 2 [Labrenzia sp. THAF82]